MNRILVGYDGSPAARKALDATVCLARESGATVTVMSVLPPIPMATELYQERGDDGVPDALEWRLEEARLWLAEHGVEADIRAYEGDPAHTIERVAEDEGFDTIVVGARARGALRRLLEGSVSAHVAAHARGTVVVAR